MKNTKKLKDIINCNKLMDIDKSHDFNSKRIYVISKANMLYSKNISKNFTGSLLSDSKHSEIKKARRHPKRLESPFEMLKYFIAHTSLHGIKYSQDLQLYKIERVFWIIFVIIGFYCTIAVTFALNQNDSGRETNIVIDDINYDVFRVPFPSVTVCPGSRVDWIEITKIANNFTTDEEVKDGFLELMSAMSTMRFSHLPKLRFNASEKALKSLNELNITDVLIKAMPKCENFIFNCSWRYSRVECCDLFEAQKTTLGFCYSFNSMMTLTQKLKVPRITHNFGFKSGIKLTLSKEFLHAPPDERMKNSDFYQDNQLAVFMVSHTRTYPSKPRYISYGRRYNIDIKFTAGFASEDVLLMESSKKPPCRSKNGEYKFENCVGLCHGKFIQNKCGCNPSFFFPFVDNVRECDVEDLFCLANFYEEIEDVQFALLSDEHNLVKEFCDCPKECDYCSYDDFVIDLPQLTENQVVMDIHFHGPTGVRYKRDIVISFLNRLVMISGVFGVFMGGSMLTVIEFTYCFVVGLLFYVYRHVSGIVRKRQETKNQRSKRSFSSREKKVYPFTM